MKYLLCVSVKKMTFNGLLSDEASGFRLSWFRPPGGKPSRTLSKSLPTPHPQKQHEQHGDPHMHVLRIISGFSSIPTPEVQTPKPHLSSVIQVTYLLSLRLTLLLRKWACDNNTSIISPLWRLNEQMYLKLSAQYLAHNESWSSLAVIFMPGPWV